MDRDTGSQHFRGSFRTQAARRSRSPSPPILLDARPLGRPPQFDYTFHLPAPDSFAADDFPRPSSPIESGGVPQLGGAQAVFVSNVSNGRRSRGPQAEGGSFHSGVQRDGAPALERGSQLLGFAASSSQLGERSPVRQIVERDLSAPATPRHRSNSELAARSVHSQAFHVTDST